MIGGRSPAFADAAMHEAWVVAVVSGGGDASCIIAQTRRISGYQTSDPPRRGPATPRSTPPGTSMSATSTGCRSSRSRRSGSLDAHSGSAPAMGRCDVDRRRRRPLDARRAVEPHGTLPGWNVEGRLSRSRLQAGNRPDAAAQRPPLRASAGRPSKRPASPRACRLWGPQPCAWPVPSATSGGRYWPAGRRSPVPARPRAGRSSKPARRPGHGR
jgi:hypothetical protein